MQPWAQPKNGSEGLNDFISDLGMGQVVGRQVLGTSCIGFIQLGLSDKKGRLEVEVVKAKELQPKLGSSKLPSTYAKVYLMDGKTCVEKMKTSRSKGNSKEPFFDCTLTFMEPYMQKMLHVMVWGDYGRLNERKVFMGVCQVRLDDLDLSNIVFGWYKLFNVQAMAGPGSYRRQSQSSLESISPRYPK
ncbi:regulating synaptic membrane exocytosis protein 3-like [Watersipora subatra]|uniref:regulating synaptic membrane exocytosis protein 3-like n=1 Tax=Watersipora subatra TaxID=2589382 RepID=UPI00355B5908